MDVQRAGESILPMMQAGKRKHVSGGVVGGVKGEQRYGSGELMLDAVADACVIFLTVKVCTVGAKELFYLTFQRPYLTKERG